MNLKFDKRVHLLFIMIVFSSCKKDITEGRFKPFEPGPCIDSVSFSLEVVPQIINVSCNVSNCHDQTKAGGLSFTNYAEISANTHPMYLATSHDPKTSNIHLSQPKLNDLLIQKFYCWIQQGRLNN